MDEIKNLILDMDGVLWRGNTPVDGLVAFFETLRRLGIRFVLATNNASKTPDQYVARLAGFGVEVAPGDIFTSALATADYLREEQPRGASVYVIGDRGLHEALGEASFNIVNPPNKERPADGLPGLLGEADLVVVGFNQNVCYRDFAEATICIRNGARLIGTNPDLTFPSERGPLPGAGALLALLEAATGVEAITVGKPGPIIFREAMKRLGGQPENTAMVGDRLETDIAGASLAGLKTILVLTGITRREDLAESEIQPDMVLADINALAAALGERL